MLKFSSKLYLDDEVLEDKKKIIRNLKRNKGQLFIYVISVDPTTGRPEMYHNALLQQKYFKKNPPTIIGIASGKDSATNLLEQIILDTYEYNQTTDCREMLHII